MAFNFVRLHFIIIHTPENTKIQMDLAVTELALTCSKSTIETLEKKCQICLKLTINTPEQCRRRSGVSIVNFEHI